MLIGIEFKRHKVHIEEENRTVWFWRIAPYTSNVDIVKFYGSVIFVLGMGTLVFLGSCIRDAQQ